MGGRKHKDPLKIKNIEIIDTANKGKAVAKYQQQTIFKKSFQRGLEGHPDLIYHILISILDAKKFC